MDLQGSFGRFSRWGEDLLDFWDGETLVRTLPTGDGPVPVSIKPRGTVEEPRLSVKGPAPAGLLRERIGSMVVTAHEELAALTEEDPAIAAVAAAVPPRRPVLSLDPFAHLVASITTQQINLRWASTLRRRLVDAYGTSVALDGHRLSYLDPGRLATAKVTELREMQFSGRKAEYIIGLAQLVTGGSLDLEGLRELEDDEVTARLTAVRGLGRWTAEWYLARVLGRPHVVAGDLGVRKAIGALYLDGAMPSESEARRLTAHWGEAALVAQQLALERLYGELD